MHHPIHQPKEQETRNEITSQILEMDAETSDMVDDACKSVTPDN